MAAADQRVLKINKLGAALMLALGGLGATGLARAESLQQVYEAARSYDATYLAARAQADSAQYRVTEAEALAKPSVGVGGSVTHQRVDPPVGNGPQPIPSGTANTTTTFAGLSGKYAIYNPANRFTIEQAHRALSIANSDLEIAEQDLIIRVSQAYFDVLAAKDALATARASKAGISEQLASAKRNFEVGTATITDTREAQARYDLATSTELAAENDLRIKGVILDTLVGRAGVTPNPLAVPVALPAVMPANVEPWVNTADEAHPAIKKARLALDIAKLETGKARATDGVTVDLTGSLGGQNIKANGVNLGSTEGTSKSGSIGVSINYPLYTGGYNQARIKETLALEERSRNDLDFARRSVAQGTRSAFLYLQSLKAQVAALEAAEASSKLALEATQLGYKVGVRVNLDVLNAQTQLFATQRDLAKARYDVVMYSLRLRQASGQLTPSDVAAANQLLSQ